MGIFKRHKEEIPRRRGNSRQNSEEYPQPVANHNSFQRNRTIVQSVEADISPRIKAHHLAIKRRKVSSILILLIISVSILFWLLSQFSGKIDVHVTDSASMTVKVDENLYAEAINNYMGANPLQRFRFLIDRDSLLKSLGINHPEVESIDEIAMDALGTTRFKIAMRKPVASWDISDKRHYVDAHGIAFEKNYYDMPAVTIVDESGVKIEDGSPVASNRLLSFVGRVVALSAEYRYSVIQAILPEDTTRQLEIKLEGQQPLIKLSIDRPAGEQVEDMVRALNYLKSNSKRATYIDVRVEGKAFYM